VQAVGENIIIVRNRTTDGDIFIFDRRTGKALRKINRKGQGGEEYTSISGITLDEGNSEMFVNNIYARKIVVYDLEGNFKRSFQHKEDFMYDFIYDFERENLICHDGRNDNSTSLSLINVGQSFVIVSKQDGSIIKEIQISFKEKKSIAVKTKDESGMTYTYTPPSVYPIIPYFDNWILVEISADTVYRYSPDHTMKPFIVRTPPVQSMNPEIFLCLSILTDRYYFMEALTKEFNIVTGDGFPATDMMYDKQEKAIFKYTVYNGDYSNKEKVYMKMRPLNEEISSWLILETPNLVAANKKGQLKGRLKEIAAELDEESNPVIMLVKHKK
jgi:hypothetical protein